MSAKREDILAGLHAVGGSIANIFKEVIPEAEHADCAELLLSLLNDIEATKPREEFRQVVMGAMRSLGYEPGK